MLREADHIDGPRRAAGLNAKLLAAAALLFVITRAWLLMGFEPVFSDAGVYFHYAVRGVDRGQTAYRDFQIEYPPAAWWWIRWPRQFQEQRLPERPTREVLSAHYRQYHASLRWHTALADALCVLLFWQIVRCRRPEWAGTLLLTYVAATALLGHLLLDRLDTPLTCLLLFWAYAWVLSLDGTADSPQWGAAAYVALGLGISFKLIPLVAAPFLLLAELNEHGWRRASLCLSLLAAAAVIPFAVHYPTAGLSTLGFLQYHGDRGIQIESLHATLLLLAQACGSPLEVQYSHGGWNLAGPAATSLKAAATPVLLAAFGLLGLWAVCKAPRLLLVQKSPRRHGGTERRKTESADDAAESVDHVINNDDNRLVKVYPILSSSSLSPSPVPSVSPCLRGGPDSSGTAQPYNRRRAWRLGCLAIVLSVALSKVFSPQYLLWALPLVLLLGADVLPQRRGRPLVLVLCVLVLAGLTTWVFPYHYFSHLPARLDGTLIDPRGLVPALSWQPCLALAIRNVLYAALIVWLAVHTLAGKGAGQEAANI